MKTGYIKYIILLCVIINTINLYSQSQDQNYIRTRTMMHETDQSKCTDVIQYYDGLGRPTQTVRKGVTPSGKDLVSLQEYDPFGRQSNSWLPAPNSGNGAFVADPAQIITNFHGDSRPYSQPKYEDSPLNRVLEQHAPGQSWSEKSVKTTYLTNNSDYPCYLFRLGSSQIIKDKLYDSGELYVLKTEDEDGNTSYEFKNKLGQVVLTRQMNGSEKYDTYYIYDDFGNQRYVLPPILSDIMSGLSSLSDTDSRMADYAYIYKYDHRNRCISKKLPGCDWKEYIYDKADQLVAESILMGSWIQYIYDKLGRLTHTANISVIGADPESERPFFENIIVNSPEAHPIGASFIEEYQLSRKYYDNNYDKLLSGAPQQLQYKEKAEYGKRHSSAQGLEIGGYEGMPYYRDLDYVLYYDDRGRVIQSRRKNHLGGFDFEYFAYNFTGQVIKKLHEHTFPKEKTMFLQIAGKDPSWVTQIDELYEYTYDHAGRLKEAKRNGVTLAKNTYDELGRVKSKEQGNNVINTSYDYNIRAWIKSIDETTTGFSQKLFYEDIENFGWWSNDDEFKVMYNGSISGMNLSFNKSKDNYENFDLVSYYIYDNLNRLTSSNELETSGGFSTFESLSYDKHGNPLKIYRSTESNIYEMLDFKHKGNQMISLTADHQLSNFSDGKTYPSETSSFAYDDNGALIKDLGRGIVTIRYNRLSQPTLIQFANGNQIAYRYSESGGRLSVTYKTAKQDPNKPIVVTEGKTIILYGSNLEKQTKTDYVGNFIYEDGVLKTVMYEGGYDEYKTYYIENITIPTSHYYVQDHLGNNRAVVNQNKTLVQRTQYHAFGLPYHNWQDPKPESSNNRFKYSGKEFDEMHGLNWYDVHARQYDPLLDRFMSVDIKAENYYAWSPYVYVGNNPLRLVDVNGKEWGIRINVDGTQTITLSVNLSISPNLSLSATQVDAYKTAISTQLNNTISEASGGLYSAEMSFDGGVDPNRFTPTIMFEGSDSGDGLILGMYSPGASEVVALYPNNAKSLLEFGETGVHELFHTLNLGDLASTPYISDTKMDRLSNGYLTTSSTANNIHMNIMNYAGTKIDGKSYKQIYKSTSGLNQLTKGQLDFLIRSIYKQMSGYGQKLVRKKNETDAEYAKRYEEYYGSYWLNPENM